MSKIINICFSDRAPMNQATHKLKFLSIKIYDKVVSESTKKLYVFYKWRMPILRNKINTLFMNIREYLRKMQILGLKLKSSKVSMGFIFKLKNSKISIKHTKIRSKSSSSFSCKKSLPSTKNSICTCLRNKHLWYTMN